MTRGSQRRLPQGSRLILLPVLILLLWLSSPISAEAYPVPPLPGDNLIQNPWFRSAANPSTPGLDGWINVLNDGVGWGTSQKVSNPSPDIVESGVCGFGQVYCGTGVRWAAERWAERTGGDVLHPNVDVFVYQVVNTENSHRKLKFFTYFVLHQVDVVEVSIFGGESSEGPWKEVWKPLLLESEDTPPQSTRPGREGNPWFDTSFLETVLDTGYSYYKLELHARYPEVEKEVGEVGVKITGVYFSTEQTDEPADVVQEAVVSLPGVTEAPSTSPADPVEPGEPPTNQAAPQRTRQPTQTTAVTVEPTVPPTPEATPIPATSVQVPPTPDVIELSPEEQTSPFLYIGIGFIGALVLIAIIYGMRRFF